MNLVGLDSHFILPSWWLKAFDSFVCLQTEPIEPHQLSEHMGMNPALNRIELDSLAVVNNICQRQILSGQDVVRVSAASHSKSLSYNSYSQRFAYERLLQLLASIQLVDVQSSRPEAIPAFGLQGQIVYEDRDLGYEFQISDITRELVLGYCDAYAEMLRKLEGRRRLSGLLYRRPLKIWQPIWLDLAGFEQILFLRLETLNQDGDNLISLDGVVAENLEALFQGLRVPTRARNNKQPKSPGRAKLDALLRLGRKLQEHGVLEQEQPFDYSIIESRFEPIALSWKLAEAYFAELRSPDYEARVAKTLLEKNSRSWVEKLIYAILGPDKQNHVSRFKDQFKRAISGLSNETLTTYHYALVEDSGHILHPLLLCLEIFLRRISERPTALPSWVNEWIDEHQITDNEGQVDLLGSYKVLSEFASNHPEERFWEKLHKLSIVYQQRYIDARAIDYLLDGIRMFQQKQMLVENEQGELSISAEFAKHRERSKKSDHAPAKLRESKSAGINRTVSNQVSEAAMRRMAIEELSRLRTHERQRYDDLKRSYIETLDPEKKKIILEVRNRLAPQTFDDHLKHSLVKYMMENPNLWFSLSSSTSS